MAIDAQRLRREGIYQAKGQLGTLFTDVEQIGRLILAIQAHRRKLRWFSLYCLIGGVVGFIASVAAGSAIVLLLAMLRIECLPHPVHLLVHVLEQNCKAPQSI